MGVDRAASAAPETTDWRDRTWEHASKLGVAAPEHHVTNLLRVSSVAPDVTAAPDAIAAWQANVRQIADAMWAEAWHAGVARGLALHVRGACYIPVTEQQYEQFRDGAMGWTVMTSNQQGFRCAVERCPILANPGREQCPSVVHLCEQSRTSIDPEDTPTFEEWVAEHKCGDHLPEDRPCQICGHNWRTVTLGRDGRQLVTDAVHSIPEGGEGWNQPTSGAEFEELAEDMARLSEAIEAHRDHDPEQGTVAQALALIARGDNDREQLRILLDWLLRNQPGPAADRAAKAFVHSTKEPAPIAEPVIDAVLALIKRLTGAGAEGACGPRVVEPAGPSCDPEQRARWLAQQVDRLVEALRLTVEYVGTETLKPTRGWTWFDALTDIAPPVAQWLADRHELVVKPAMERRAQIDAEAARRVQVARGHREVVGPTARIDLTPGASDGGGKPCRPVPCPAVDPLPEPDGLVFMLIEFEQGESVGHYWPIENPSLAAHLQHLASHTGPGRWQVTAHFGESNQIYVRVDPGVQPPRADAGPEQP